MSDPGQRFPTAYEVWLQHQHEVSRPVEQQAAPSEFQASPRNFLPPQQRGSWTTPAGTSEIYRRALADDGEAQRPMTADEQRREQAQLARQIEQANRLAGSSTVRNPREDARRGWHSELQRNPRTGVLTTTWRRDAADDVEIV